MLHQGQSLEIFGGEIISTKKAVMDSYFRSNLQYFIFLKMNLSINITLQVIMKNFMFKERTWLWSSILVKKTKITRFALTRNLRNGDCLKIFLLAVCLFGIFFFFICCFFGGRVGERGGWVSFYSKFAGFFSKAAYYID